MAGLNLTPHIPAVAAQAGIFLSAVFVVKKLMLEPYLEVQAKREKNTVGNKAAASDIQKENEKMVQDIVERQEAAGRESRKLSTSIIQQAREKKDSILAAASKEAVDLVESVREKVDAGLEEERNRIPQFVSELTQVVYQKTLN